MGILRDWFRQRFRGFASQVTILKQKPLCAAPRGCPGAMLNFRARKAEGLIGVRKAFCLDMSTNQKKLALIHIRRLSIDRVRGNSMHPKRTEASAASMAECPQPR